MKKTKIIYWVFTGLFGAIMFLTAIPDVLSSPDAVTFMTKLGYPLYFIPFIGVVKVLGVIAILIPGFPRIKEWAYAGLTFDLVGAVYSIIASGTMKNPTDIIPMSIFFILLIGSYVYCHKKLNAGLENVK